MPVGKGYARKSKATRYAGGYLLVGAMSNIIPMRGIIRIRIPRRNGCNGAFFI